MRIILFFLCMSITIVAFACKEHESKKATATLSQKAKKGNGKVRNKTMKNSYDWLVPSYEVIRKALAADDLAAAQKGAKDLSLSSSSGGKLVTFANGITHAKDVAAARLAFGELSKEVIQIVAGNAYLAKGLEVYECPMAKGFKKWLQADADMANPYMGKSMLKCGGKSKLAP